MLKPDYLLPATNLMALGRNHFIAPLQREGRNKAIAPYKDLPLRGTW